MNLFCDCEFNGTNGGLMSMGLISEDGNRSFYEVIQCNETIDPWVAANVVPILDKPALSKAHFQTLLKKFLGQFAGIHVIVNHPSDVMYFCQMLMEEQGKWIMNQPLTFEVDDDLSAKQSTRLHNAYADAVATRDSWFKKHGYS